MGALGYMTLSTYIIYRLTHHINNTTGNIVSASVSIPYGIKLHDLVSSIIHFTVLFELLGFISFARFHIILCGSAPRRHAIGWMERSVPVHIIILHSRIQPFQRFAMPVQRQSPCQHHRRRPQLCRSHGIHSDDRHYLSHKETPSLTYIHHQSHLAYHLHNDHRRYCPPRFQPYCCGIPRLGTPLATFVFPDDVSHDHCGIQHYGSVNACRGSYPCIFSDNVHRCIPVWHRRRCEMHIRLCRVGLCHVKTRFTTQRDIPPAYHTALQNRHRIVKHNSLRTDDIHRMHHIGLMRTLCSISNSFRSHISHRHSRTKHGHNTRSVSHRQSHYHRIDVHRPRRSNHIRLRNPCPQQRRKPYFQEKRSRCLTVPVFSLPQHLMLEDTWIFC